MLITAYIREIVRKEMASMKQDKQDRRSMRTRRLVQSAMMDLLLEKRYETITVRDILDQAGIGSSTFYAHYFDKDDVQASLMEMMLEQLSQPYAQKATEQEILPSLALFQHGQEHFRSFQAMVKGHAEGKMWEITQTTLNRTIEQNLVNLYAGKHAPSVPLTVVAQYLTGAFVNLFKWWIEADMPYSPERMDEIFRQLALPGMWTIIEKPSV